MPIESASEEVVTSRQSALRIDCMLNLQALAKSDRNSSLRQDIVATVARPCGQSELHPADLSRGHISMSSLGNYSDGPLFAREAISEFC
jgi:hypothetical protein